MDGKPRRFASFQKGKTFVSPNASRSRVLTPSGTAAEVGRELRNLIRIVDVYIIGKTKNWDALMKKYLVLARNTVGASPREEAEALLSLVAATGLHLIEPNRWKVKAWYPEIIPVMQSARKVLGLKEDDRFEEGEGILK